MNKPELRKKYKELRKNLSEKEIEEKSLAIANQLLQMDIWNKTYYHLFLTIEEQNEINTEFILQILHGKDKEIVISKSDFNSYQMTHYLLTDNTKFKKNQHNIPEPIDGLEVPVSKIDVVFVPLLAFDLKGNRVGYGKGFYDNFLSECNNETIKIGLSFFEAEPIIESIYESDIQLNYCVTPEKNYRF
ncbi:5-formyltetrahydrofolate cyclo-ligase [Flavobacterium sp. SUN052]|uniref:5-formyltetrahydrofolate cyclo-ligase n=1 Tax=Flavobacterium sp. SUN052 TaxID=3002441 RepID=UPI00237D7E85|nr:5-formyltetrahydrofolate cyclo-ligase [Flavobacterium sp. SUN052]MEC4004266.1 5-formyltetrahydrofolate cyclo-ligase [Flavobacterium sp. SUN052]